MTILMHEINQNQVNFYSVSVADEQMRVDNLLSKILKGVPKSHIYRIIRAGEVRINKARCTAKHKVNLNDIIRIPPIRIATPAQIKPAIPKAVFPILFEDDHYLIINKPHGVACHGGSGVAFGVIEQLRQNLNYPFLELVHRLDKETSGILVLAKKRSALVALQEMSKNQLITKEYLALTTGQWQDARRSLKAPILKYRNKDAERMVRIDHQQGNYAHTIFNVRQKFAAFTLVLAQLKTGRTHQIRIHSQHLGHPIAGDPKYGIFEHNRSLQKLGLKRMFLHAYRLVFCHPVTQQQLEINCPLPAELNHFLTTLPPLTA